MMRTEAVQPWRLELPESDHKKRVFVLLRYTFIIAAGYLVLFAGAAAAPWSVGTLIIAAILSNVALSFVPEHHLFAWYLEMPIVVIDTLWVSYCFGGSGIAGRDFFLVYFFVLTLAAIGENLATVLLGAVFVGAVNLYSAAVSGGWWSSPTLLRIPFFFTVALFYGHSATIARHERRRAENDHAVAQRLEALVQERTQALTAKAGELESLWRRAQEASRLKSEFVSTLSHEFLSPLHIVLGYIELLLERPGAGQGLDEDAHRLLERIQHNARRLLEMVRSVLDFARLESGTVTLVPTRIDLAELAHDVTGAQQLLHPPAVRVRYELDTPLPQLLTDRQKLRALLSNLLNNAVKFTPQGEVVLSVRVDAFENRVHFAVRDTGIGIPPEDIGVIFNEFQQLDGSARRRYEGVGLGLAIARRYAELLGGQLTVESQVGTGSCFQFSLPNTAQVDTPLAVSEFAPLQALAS